MRKILYQGLDLFIQLYLNFFIILGRQNPLITLP
ncbi:MAG: hypothetical protein JWQ09_1043 [Segetibacter sp.]|nr:hypothetical protein [Segetibacter sp.]